MALSQWTSSNLVNSVAEFLADKVLQAGYLVYWHGRNSLQTLDGFYPNYSTNQAAILAIPAVAAHWATARGVLTFLSPDFAFPQRLERPTTDGTVPFWDSVPLPCLAVQVEHAYNASIVGLGSRERQRYARLDLTGYSRNYNEQQWLLDRLREWFDEQTTIVVRDHDAGTRVEVGGADTERTLVMSDIVALANDLEVYEYAVTTRLRYEA